jgi:DNA polymerase-3 subunit delta'
LSILHFNGLPANIEALVSKKNIDPKIALKIAHQAQEISTKHCNYKPIANLVFLKNVRAAFRAKGNAAIQDLILWNK